MSDEHVEVLVIGAGIAGLAAARDLALAGFEPLLVDAGDRVGGVMRSDLVDGYLVESGPNTFQAKAPTCAFLARHLLEDAVVAASPESRRRALFHGGELVSVPHGVASAVMTPLLSVRAKLRLVAEPFVRRGDPAGESVHEFIARRLGPEVATHLVGAFLTGVYAGDEFALGAEAVFPALVAYEREHGSLLRGGVAGMRRSSPGGREAFRGRPGTWSSPRGLGDLAGRVARELPRAVELGTRVAALGADAGCWRADLVGPAAARSVTADHVVVAVPSYAAADLLEPVDREAAVLLRGISYAPIAALAVGIDPRDAREPIEGFGFIVPRAAGMKLLGCLFMSRLFEGRAPDGLELLHLMVGGVRWEGAAEAPDDVLRARALEDLDRCIGLRAQPDVVAIRRWSRAIPQPDREHTRTIAALERRVGGHPGLALAGSYLSGVSVSDTLASGVRAAERTLAARVA